MKLILLMALAVVGVSPQSSQKPESQTECPMRSAHTKMNERGEKGMGFSQTATTHHFLLNANGGVRMHLGHIAKAFQSGDFDIPMFVHDTVPPGVPKMKRLLGVNRESWRGVRSSAFGLPCFASSAPWCQ